MWACPSQSLGSGFPLQVRALITGLAGFPLQSVTRNAASQSTHRQLTQPLACDLCSKHTEVMTHQVNTEQPRTTAAATGLQEVVSSLDGIALPPIVKRGLLHAMNRLLGGLVDIPAAHLEAITQRIKTEANAQSAFTMSVAQAAATGFNQDPELVNRAVNHYGAKLVREQGNRERISQGALDDLRLNPPNEVAKEEVNDDWLETFSRIAETKSAEDIQLILSKILSGELRQPGSYKQRTLHVLSTLDQQTGKIFQAF